MYFNNGSPSPFNASSIPSLNPSPTPYPPHTFTRMYIFALHPGHTLRLITVESHRLVGSDIKPDASLDSLYPWPLFCLFHRPYHRFVLFLFLCCIKAVNYSHRRLHHPRLPHRSPPLSLLTRRRAASLSSGTASLMPRYHFRARRPLKCESETFLVPPRGSMSQPN